MNILKLLIGLVILPWSLMARVLVFIGFRHSRISRLASYSISDLEGLWRDGPPLPPKIHERPRIAAYGGEAIRKRVLGEFDAVDESTKTQISLDVVIGLDDKELEQFSEEAKANCAALAVQYAVEGVLKKHLKGGAEVIFVRACDDD